MSSARDNLWESVDGSFIPNGNLDSLTSSNLTHRAAERPALEVEDGTIVTEDAHDSEGSDSAPEDADSDQYRKDDDSDSEISFGNADQGVPAEVKLLSFRENDNDSDSEPSGAEDSEEELDAEESEEEDDDGESVDRDTASEYETDEDSVESERSEEDGDLMDESSCGSAPSRTNDDNFDSPAPSESSPHELFLPWDVSPTIQSLKYEEEEDDESSDEEEDSSHYFHRTYMIGSGRSGRPRMWDGCPCGVSVSSDSGSSSGSSQGSKCSKRSRESAKTGVSFSDSVTVYPVFEKAAYPPSVVESIYTKREELRVNKLRNKREFAYDRYDWRNATEEDEMEPDEAGELIHPVHCEENIQPSLTRTRKAVQTYSSTLGGYTIGSVNSSGAIHQAKRMRMYHL